MREELREREKKWEKEREGITKKIRELEEKVEKMGKEVKERKENSVEKSGFIDSEKGSRRVDEGARCIEDKLNEKEVIKIKKWMAEKEREERKCNIIIKGLKLLAEDKEGIENFLRDRIKVDCRILSCRRSGPVIVAKCESWGKKRR